MYYFSGDNPGQHVCECGLSDSCDSFDGENLPCNCDGNLPTWAADQGQISSMTDLPIMAFAYGPLEYEIQQANITINRLKCYGKLKHYCESKIS